MRARCTTLPLALSALLWAAAAPLAAQQQVRGVLVDSVARRPAALVTVVLVDDAGAPVAQGLSTNEGRFALTAPRRGRYRVRALRVGYQPVTSEPIELAEGAAPPAELSLTLRSVPVNLSAVRVTAKAKCVVRPGEGSAAFAVWEEARKALQATLLGQASALVRMRVADVQRDLDPRSLRPRREERVERHGVSANPYESPPPRELARDGYVRTEGTSTTYYAPDARVLLSDEFFRDHCVRPRRDPERPGAIGLAFEPVKEITRPDIAGVLWLDERTAELRHLEYRYTGIPDDISSPALGGRVDFQRLPAGHWIIQRWEVRAPMVSTPARPSGVTTLGSGLTPVESRVLSGIREAVGEVEEAAALDGTRLWGGRAGAVVGVVTDSMGAPLAGATVFLQGGGAPPAVTDARGRYRLDGAPAGRRTLLWSPPPAQAVSASLRGPALDVARDSSTEAPPVSMPRAPALRGDLCADGGRPLGGALSGVLVGLVRDSAARAPARAAAVDLRWETIDASPGADRRTVSEQLRVRTDSLGWFRACALPHGIPLQLRATLGDRSATAPPVTLDATGIVRKDVIVP
ncbi:MAG TPA: carboxypeptidase-like regulatory domain-containing protein [Gemmatimonadaceae bacterium]|nr:carboxypeptidase-like regulatory domain-containing protein [Gemmatimonadaceae bacterium]